MLVDIIIPTFNNPDYLAPCLRSIIACYSSVLNKVIVVNNGHCGVRQFVPNHPNIAILQMERNVGWEGGLIAGLKHSKAPFVVFMNDDTKVMPFANTWLQRMLVWFKHDDVGAVGPSSNVVSGLQNVFHDIPHKALFVSHLIGFCIMLKRETLDEVGGVDSSLPGGDDIDLSIRLTKAGKKLVCLRDLFIFHHGFKTGEREYGSYWNSLEMSTKTNHALIKKHGLKEWYKPLKGHNEIVPAFDTDFSFNLREEEKDVVKGMMKEGSTIEFGCGAEKTVPEAVGVDIVPKGGVIPFLEGAKSVADIVGDVSEYSSENTYDNLIARHVLEHCIDSIKTMRSWLESLAEGGRMIIVVPDQRTLDSIPLNPQHLHGFTPSSLDNIAFVVGLKEVAFKENYNGISFVKVYEREVQSE
jgi:GT2 family glycosyltransferase/predicted SAM-dependent methyltransferase